MQLSWTNLKNTCVCWLFISQSSVGPGMLYIRCHAYPVLPIDATQHLPTTQHILLYFEELRERLEIWYSHVRLRETTSWWYVAETCILFPKIVVFVKRSLSRGDKYFTGTLANYKKPLPRSMRQRFFYKAWVNKTRYGIPAYIQNKDGVDAFKMVNIVV